jgi:hypothetical protein
MLTNTNWVAVIIVAIFIWIVSDIIDKTKLSPVVSYYIGIAVALFSLFLNALIYKV